MYTDRSLLSSYKKGLIAEDNSYPEPLTCRTVKA